MVKRVEVGYLPSMGPEDAPNYVYKPGCLQLRTNSPKRGWATARFEANIGDFRVHLTVVGPEPEEAKYSLTFSDAKVQRILKAADNLVEVLKKEAFGEDTP